MKGEGDREAVEGLLNRARRLWCGEEPLRHGAKTRRATSPSLRDREETVASENLEQAGRAASKRWRVEALFAVGAAFGRSQKISNRPAAPMPPPMHMVTTPYLAPRRLPSIKTWPVMRAPDIP